MPESAEQRPRGLACPNPACRGAAGRMHVYRTRRPAHDLIVRYRECPTCHRRVRTEERFAGVLPPGEQKDQDSPERAG